MHVRLVQEPMLICPNQPIPLMQPKSMAKTLEMKSSNLDDLLERYVDNGNPRRMFKVPQNICENMPNRSCPSFLLGPFST